MMRCFALNAPIEKLVSLFTDYLNRDRSFSAREISVSLHKKEAKLLQKNGTNMVWLRTLLSALIVATVKGAPFPFPYPYPFPDPQCCTPGPSCSNPCAPPMMPPPPPPAPCCAPSPTCMNPCQPGQMPPNQPLVYAPYPGEITFKLVQKWNPDYLDANTASYQILEGNVRRAIQTVLGPMTQVANIYFREGSVPGNPTARPKVVVHCMVNGGSDSASLLEMAVTPDGTLGDGLKVYKDSFNAY